jgi:hypothetical protein
LELGPKQGSGERRASGGHGWTCFQQQCARVHWTRDRSSLVQSVAGLRAAEPMTSATTKKLRDAGFHVESKLEALGALTGTLPAGKLDEIKGIKGVKAVELERGFQLAPPESDVQ